MAITDRQILKNAQSGQIGSNGSAIDPLTPVTGSVAGLNTKYYQFLVQDAATAGTAVTETAIHIPVAGKVVSVSMTAPIAVAQAASNIATVTVAKRTAAGGATTIAAKSTVTSTGVALAAFVPYKFVAGDFTLANINLAADDVLTLAIAKGASGVALTAATSYFTVCVGVEEN